MEERFDPVLDKVLEMLVDIQSQFKKLKELALENRQVVEVVKEHDTAIETLNDNRRYIISEFKKLVNEKNEILANIEKHENEISKIFKYLKELETRVTDMENTLTKHSENLDRDM